MQQELSLANRLNSLSLMVVILLVSIHSPNSLSATAWHERTLFFLWQHKTIFNCWFILKLLLLKFIVVPWCSCYHHCTSSFHNAWTQVLCRFKSCSWHIKDLRWWRSLAMVPAGNKAKRCSLVSHTAKIIHHHHHIRSNKV